MLLFSMCPIGLCSFTSLSGFLWLNENVLSFYFIFLDLLVVALCSVSLVVVLGFIIYVVGRIRVLKDALWIYYDT